MTKITEIKSNTSYKWTQISTSTGMIRLHVLNSVLLTVCCILPFTARGRHSPLAVAKSGHVQQHLGELSDTVICPSINITFIV